MSFFPGSTVTFLFTDREPGSINSEQESAGSDASLARQDTILRETIEANGGNAYKTIGYALQVAFPTATSAVRAAVDAQRQLQREGLGVRMALHSGVTEEREGDYVGPLLNRVARLLSAGHTGQILLTAATAMLVADDLPEGVTLRDLGDHRLRDLVRPEHVYQAVAPGLASDYPPLRTLDSRPNNLPTQANPFVGRQQQLDDVRALLLREDVQLVTLVGAGGIGKTRLALQLGAEMLESFDDGVFFVNLAPISGVALLLPAIAQAIGVREAGDQPLPELLRQYLEDKQMLLIMDNFEQIVDASLVLAGLLTGASELKALVTSRSALRLSMEYEYPVPPLSLPDLRNLPPAAELSEAEAVRLFVTRARAAKPDFEITEQNARAVAEICARLDAIPLAIELAAARIKILPPEALLTRLGNSLKLLTGGGRDLPARQQTLRSAIDWSYNLLDGEEQKLFRRLSVFVGGHTLEAAEEVCSGSRDLNIDVLDGLESLLNKSLVYQREGQNGESRFWMLQTIHEYAAEQLALSGEADAFRLAHGRLILEIAEQAEVDMRGEHQVATLEMLEEEHDNIRTALEWCLAIPQPGQPGTAEERERTEIALRIAAALYRFWETRGHLSEGRTWLKLALGIQQGGVAPSDTEALDSNTLELARGKAFNVAGNLALDQGDNADARRCHEMGLAIRRRIGDRKGESMSLGNLANVAWAEGNLAEARALQTESLAMKRELGDKWGATISMNNLAIIAQAEKNYAEAYALLSEGLAFWRELGDKLGLADSLVTMAEVAYDQGDYYQSAALHSESLVLRRELGDKFGMAMSMEGLAGVAGALADQMDDPAAGAVRAARLLGAASVIRESIGTSWFLDEQHRYELYTSSARAHLSDADWQIAWAEGRNMNVDDAIDYALAAD